MRKSIKGLMCIFIFAVVVLMFPQNVEAATSGDWEYELLEDGTAEITGYNGSVTNLVIPSELEEYAVVGIGEKAFYNCRNLTSITIHSGVKNIGDYAFYGCSSLGKITIPDGVKAISNYAFQNCTSLTQVEIPNSVKSILYGAFLGCRSLTNITIPESVTRISYSAFENCRNLKTVTMKAMDTVIVENAFENCSTALRFICYAESTAETYAQQKGLQISYIDNNSYTIEYDANGGTGAPASQTKNKGETLTLSSTEPTRTGYEFLGWSTSSSAASAEYSAGASYTADNSVKLYAVWKNIDWEYSLSGNKATVTGYNGSETEFMVPSEIDGYQVTGIGDRVFLNCSSLASITIPSSVTSIGTEVFAGCSSLTSITIPANVTNIGSAAFGMCSSLNDIIVEQGNQYYCVKDRVLFSKDMSQLHTYLAGNKNSFYVIPEGVTKIEYGAFAGCSSLARVVISEGVTFIGDYAFQECSGLTSITIPLSVTNIESGAFWACPKTIEFVCYPESAAEAYAQKNDFRISYIDSDFYTIEYDANGGIGAPASQTKNQGETLTLSSTEPTRTGYEFLGWSASSSATSADFSAGASYTADSSIKLYAVWKNTIDWEYSLSGNKATITDYKGSATELVVPSEIDGYQVTDIGADAFKNCSSLTSITIPNGVTGIGARAFAYCSNLENITLPNGIDEIYSNTFSGCSSLTEEVIPESVTSIGDFAFYECSSLKNVTIPSGVTSIGERAFSYCSNLTGITLPEEVTSISYEAFAYCSSLTDITIPNGLTMIAASVFRNCSKLENVIISDSVTVIGDYAFNNCGSLKNIRISENVTRIGQYAFGNCSNLETVTMQAMNTNINENAFKNCLTTLEFVCYPNSTAAAYAQEKGFQVSYIEENYYTIEYDANGGSGAPSSQIKTHEITLTLSSAKPVKTGYTFKGWSTDSADSAVTYQPGDNYTNNESITLYAVWERNAAVNTYTITYDANGGSGAPSSQTKPHGGTLTLSITEPIREGYEFLGWSADSSASSAEYSAGGSYTTDSSVTLYAVWKRNAAVNTYTITYDANGGSGAPSSQIKTHEITLTLSSAKPVKTGYTFKGWSTDSADSVVTYQPGDNYTNNESITLYAVWKKAEVQVAVKAQTITASSKTVAYGSKAFNLNAKTNGDGKLTYSSSNKKVVTVDAKGKVKVKGCGKATITIKAAATDNYKSAVKKITITVNPKQVTLKSVTSLGKKKLSAAWKKDSGVTGYQVMFSTKKKFNKETYERSFKKSTTKFSVVGVKSGKKYYVKVRSYKTVNGTKYYGAWSKVKSVRIK